MKLRFTYTVFSLAFLALVFSSSSGGRAGAANEGNTGAPGDAASNCVTCHGNNSDIQVTLSIDLQDDMGNSIASTGYVPETTYDAIVTINVDAGSPGGFGFQIVGLNASLGVDGPAINDWSEPGANVQISNVSSTGRTYAEHKGVSSSNEFRMKWTAPAAGSGDVSFYACGNGVDGLGSTGGDNAACNTFELAEKVNTNTNQPVEALELSIAPNPVDQVINLHTFSPNSGDYDLVITDINGRQVYTEVFDMPQGEASYPIFVSELNTGIYFLHLKGNGQMITRQLIKK